MGQMAEHDTAVGAGRDPMTTVPASEYGAPYGVACLNFHATNSGRTEGALFDAPARQHGVRLLSLDRPDAGGWPPRRETTLPRWADHVRAVADAVGIETFAVAGWSAGACLALACAHAMPRRVTGGVLINIAAPADAAGLDAQQRSIVYLCRHVPWLIRWALAPLLVRAVDTPPERLHDPRRRERALRFFPRTDRALIRDVLADPVQLETLAAMGAASRSAGPVGTASDLLAIWGRPGWGFDPFAVDVPLHAYAGERDTSAESAAGSRGARRTPPCTSSPAGTTGSSLTA